MLGSSVPDSSGFFGVKGDRSCLENIMGVAVGWGGMQRRDARTLTAPARGESSRRQGSVRPVPQSEAARAVVRKSLWARHLTALATKAGEKGGLGPEGGPLVVE